MIFNPSYLISGTPRLSDRQLMGAKEPVIEPQVSVAQIPQLQSRSTQRQGSRVGITFFYLSSSCFISD